MKKQIIEVPDTHEFRSALIFHNLDCDLGSAITRVASVVHGLNVTDESVAIRKINELWRDLSRQFAEIWQRAHGGIGQA